MRGNWWRSPQRAAPPGERRIEARRPLRRALDVLIQHLVTLAAGPGFGASELLAEVRTSHAYSSLSDAEWRWALDFVTRGGNALQGYPQYRRVMQCDDGLLRVADRGIARRHRMSIGTISSDTEMLVKWMNGGTARHRRGVVHRPPEAGRRLRIRGPRAEARAGEGHDGVRARFDRAPHAGAALAGRAIAAVSRAGGCRARDPRQARRVAGASRNARG